MKLAICFPFPLVKNLSCFSKQKASSYKDPAANRCARGWGDRSARHR